MNISLKCRCGALRGIARNVDPAHALRIVCHCDDCQAFAHHLGRARDVLDRNGGSDIVAVVPANLTLTQGVENLACLRLSPNGTFRWYAGCCKTPIANTRPTRRMPWAGTLHVIMDHAGDGTTRDTAVGPVRARVLGKYGIGELPPGTQRTMSPGLLLRVLRFLAKAVITRQYAPSPFFDEAGKPRVEPYVLTRAERDALRPLCGPRPA